MRARTLGTVVFAELVCGALTLVVPVWLSVPLAAVVLVVMPGATVSAALLGMRRDGVESVATMLGVGVAVAIFLAVVVGVLGEVSRFALLAAAVGVTAVGAVAAAPRGDRDGVPAKRSRSLPRLRDVVLFAAAAAVAGWAVAYARTPLSARGVSGYTTLWIVPARVGARVGVASSELGRRRYRLDVQAKGMPAVVRVFALSPGKQRVLGVRVPTRARGVTATLYVRGGHRWREYRRVRLAASPRVKHA